MLKTIVYWFNYWFDIFCEKLVFVLENMWTPIHWNRLGRRIFLLTLPVSVPLWVVFILFICIVVMILFIIIMPITVLVEFAKKMWYDSNE